MTVKAMSLHSIWNSCSDSSMKPLATRVWSCLTVGIVLKQELANIFGKGPQNEYFWLCGQYGVSPNDSTLLLWLTPAICDV